MLQVVPQGGQLGTTCKRAACMGMAHPVRTSLAGLPCQHRVVVRDGVGRRLKRPAARQVYADVGRTAIAANSPESVHLWPTSTIDDRATLAS